MRIGQLSKLTGVSRRSLRYYEECGVLHSRRTEQGWREYDDEALVRVRNVQRLIGAGLGVEDIRRIAPCLDVDLDDGPACREAIEMYLDRMAELDRKIAVLTGHRQQLQGFVDQLRAGMPEG